MSLDSRVPRYLYKPTTLASFSEPKSVGDGMFRANVPGTLTVDAADADIEPLEHTVVLELDAIDGRLLCVSCSVKRKGDGPPVTADALRRVPVARYIREAAQGAGLVVLEVDPHDDSRSRPFVGPPRNFAESGMTDAVLREVARIYYWSLAIGDAPLGMLEREYGVPRGKASRWISTARRRGYVKDEPDGR